MTKTRVRRSHAEWEGLVERYRTSGLSIAKFAAQLGVPEATLGRWITRLAPAAIAPPDAGPRLVPVVRRATASPVWIEVGPARVHVGPGFDPALVRDLVRALAVVVA